MHHSSRNVSIPASIFSSTLSGNSLSHLWLPFLTNTHTHKSCKDRNMRNYINVYLKIANLHNKLEARVIHEDTVTPRWTPAHRRERGREIEAWLVNCNRVNNKKYHCHMKWQYYTFADNMSYPCTCSPHDVEMHVILVNHTLWWLDSQSPVCRTKIVEVYNVMYYMQQPQVTPCTVYMAIGVRYGEINQRWQNCPCLTTHWNYKPQHTASGTHHCIHISQPE